MSHFILDVLNYYVLISNYKYNVLFRVHIVLQNTFAAIEEGYGLV